MTIRPANFDSCERVPDLRPSGEFTLQDVLRLPSGLQKEYLLARCYSPYIYLHKEECPGGKFHDGREDGRYFLVQPSLPPNRWGMWEYRRFDHQGQWRYYGQEVFLLSVDDLWQRFRSEGFLTKFDSGHYKFNGTTFELKTSLCHYGPGPIQEVMVEVFVRNKWLAEDPPVRTHKTPAIVWGI